MARTPKTETRTEMACHILTAALVAGAAWRAVSTRPTPKTTPDSTTPLSSHSRTPSKGTLSTQERDEITQRSFDRALDAELRSQTPPRQLVSLEDQLFSSPSGFAFVPSIPQIRRFRTLASASRLHKFEEDAERSF